MARETGRELNAAIKTGVRKGYGIGRSVGEYILLREKRLEWQEHLC